MFNQELISREFCFWLSGALRSGGLTKKDAEKLSLIFRVGLAESESFDDIIAYLEGVYVSSPFVSELISHLIYQNQIITKSQNEKIIIDFAQKFINDPEIAEFLEQANKNSNIEKLAIQFPKFREFLDTLKSK